MTARLRISAIALAVSVGWALPVAAQDTDGAALRAEMAQMRSDMAAMAQRMAALESELTRAQTKIEADNVRQASEVAALTAASTAAAAPKAKPEIAFKGAPEIKGANGWSFKPRGRMQYDAGFTSVPASTGRSDGFGNEVRRARLGVSGDMPGGFGYKVEVDFAGSDLSVNDAALSYETGDAELTVGQFNTFQSLEELTSSLHTSFIERAAFTDAFGFERRLGAAAEYKGEVVLVQAGVFTDNMDDLSNKNIGFDGRIVAMPKMGDAQLHLGASLHYNDLETGQTVRYRQRPLVHFTSERFVNTGSLDAQSEFGLGLEGAVIAGPFHAAAEAYWQNVDRVGALPDPTFFGGSLEAGIFLTKGDTRGYKGGKFGRVKPSYPVNKGGIGSIQLNLRYDYLDLNDGGIIGGQQNGYLASLVWKPTDYVLFLANYGRLDYSDAVHPEMSGNRNYGVDVFAVRAQVDF